MINYEYNFLLDIDFLSKGVKPFNEHFKYSLVVHEPFVQLFGW